MTMYEEITISPRRHSLIDNFKTEIFSSLKFTFNAPGICYSNVNTLNIAKEFTVQNEVIAWLHKIEIRIFTLYLPSSTVHW
jgi:hypothetical protein